MPDYLLWHGVTMVVWGACWGLLCLLLCLGRLRQAPRLVGIAALVCALRYGLLVAPLYTWMVWLGFRLAAGWISALGQPALGLLLLGTVVYGLKWVTPAEVGLRKLRPGSGRPVLLVVGAVVAAMVLNTRFARQSLPALGWDQRLFLATLPGLAEELFYRGVLLGLLSRVFARCLPLPGTRTSWGGMVVVGLFALAHGLKSQAYEMALFSASKLHVSLQGWYYWLPLWHSSLTDQLYYLAQGTLFLWVRERTGSVWAAAGTHCLMNACVLVGSAIG